MVPTPSFCPVRRWVLRALAGRNLPCTHITSRLRRDAALSALLSPTRLRKSRRDGPRTKGRPLPTPQKTVQHCRSWQKATVNRRGKLLHRFVYNQQVLWHLLFLSPHHSHG